MRNKIRIRRYAIGVNTRWPWELREVGAGSDRIRTKTFAQAIAIAAGYVDGKWERADEALMGIKSNGD